jgi:hypothetical protein
MSYTDLGEKVMDGLPERKRTATIFLTSKQLVRRKDDGVMFEVCRDGAKVMEHIESNYMWFLRRVEKAPNKWWRKGTDMWKRMGDIWSTDTNTDFTILDNEYIPNSTNFWKWMRHFNCKHEHYKTAKEFRVLGATLSWAGRGEPLNEHDHECLCCGKKWSTHTYLPRDINIRRGQKYNEHGWPLDMVTDEKMEIYHDKG